MHWKIKAMIQNGVSVLPSEASYEMYYWIQRHFGNLKQTNPTQTLTRAVKACSLIRQSGQDPAGKIFFEVGTGRDLNAPIAYWLLGAQQVITIDVNPYLKGEILQESIHYIAANTEKIRTLFEGMMLEDRLDALVRLLGSSSFSTDRVLELCRIQYIAPGDAAHTSLPAGSIDYHTSIVVLQHIPPDVLPRIILEGNRIIRDDGMFVHRINYSDHFSHSDATISALNFLQFSDAEWNKYAGNRYMYANRLRHDDFLDLFRSAGQCIVAEYPDVDRQLQMSLQNGTVKLHPQFRNKSVDVLSILSSWIVSQKCH
jgi:hypothetical protein